MQGKQRVKVLHVAPLPPPLGGMVTYIQGLLSSDVFKEIDYKVVRSSYFNKENYSGLVRNFINIINAFVVSAVFLFRVITWRPNIVHIQSNSGFGYFEKAWIALLAKIFGCRTVFHFHGGNFPSFYGNSSKFVQFLIKKAALINNRIITGSPQMKDNWVEIGIPLNRIAYIGNAVNLPKIEANKNGKKIIILILTRITIATGMIELIDAFSLVHEKHPETTRRIVGAESQDSELIRQHIQNTDGNQAIAYVGPVSDGQKRQELLNATIFAFPTYFEDQSYAVMEAMSYGLPCVASNVGGVPSLINHGQNGILIKPRDVESLRDALEKLIKDEELRRKLGENARLTIKEGFTWEIRSAEIIRMYNEVLHE